MPDTCPHCEARVAGLTGTTCPECGGSLAVAAPPDAGIIPAIPIPVPVPAPRPRRFRDREEDDTTDDARQRIDFLEQRVADLEHRLRQSHLYNENFFARAFTVYGHLIVAHLCVVAPIVALAMCAGMIGR